MKVWFSEFCCMIDKLLPPLQRTSAQAIAVLAQGGLLCWHKAACCAIDRRSMDDTNVRPTLQQMRRKAMPEPVRRREFRTNSKRIPGIIALTKNCAGFSPKRGMSAAHDVDIPRRTLHGPRNGQDLRGTSRRIIRNTGTGQDDAPCWRETHRATPATLMKQPDPGSSTI